MSFKSNRFSGDSILEACLAGKHRMYAGATGESVKAVQQALIDLGHPLVEGASGVFSARTGALVAAFKLAHKLSPSDPVVGSGTMKALDADIFALDSGRAPVPPAPSIPHEKTSQMQGKFLFSGQGAKVPVVNFGLSASLFKLWLKTGDGQFRGYTAGSNEGLMGAALLETPIVSFNVADATKFTSLHGSVVDVTITPSIFVKSDGIASILMVVKSNKGPSEQLSFHASSVKGFSAVNGSIHFTAELLLLNPDEMDPTARRYVPW